MVTETIALILPYLCDCVPLPCLSHTLCLLYQSLFLHYYFLRIIIFYLCLFFWAGVVADTDMAAHWTPNRHIARGLEVQ